MTTREYPTEDMTLVTVFKLRGMEPDRMEKSNGGCKWVYVCTDALEDVIVEYHAEEAYVEPREFSRKLGLVRTEMYRFLDIKPRRVRR